jgi:D-inositol-3-phosphate glycosyltransferase
MKVCAVSYHSSPFVLPGGETTGGMSVYLKEILSTLAGYKGVEIDVYTRSQDPSSEKVTTIRDSLRLINVAAGPPGLLDRKNLFSHVPEFIGNVERYIAENKKSYNIVYSHYWLSGLVGEWIRLNHSVPMVHTFHTLQHFKGSVLDGDEDEIRNMAEEHISKISDTIISSSTQEHHFLVDMMAIPPGKCRIIHPGVNPQLFHPVESDKAKNEIGRTKDDLMMAYVGRIDPVKGLAGLVDVLKILRDRDPKVYEKFKLTVIGGGRLDGDFQTNEEAARIKTQLDEQSMMDKILFLGSRKQEDLCRYYSAADALFFPSLYESFGLAVGEAMACGRPVLASKIGEINALIENGKNGFSFTAGDSSAAADAIISFDRQKHSLWSEDRIRRFILKKLSWEKSAARIYKEFTKLKNVRPKPTTISRHDENLQPI